MTRDDEQVPATASELNALVQKLWEVSDPSAGPYLPLDPNVRARIRRTSGDAAQLAWDACANPGEMLKALLRHEPDPAILLPPARFIAVATERFMERGSQVDPTIWNQTMRTSAQMIVRGNFNAAVIWLRHAYTGAGLACTPAAAYQEMSDLVRYFFPCAPDTWQAVAPVDERKTMMDKAVQSWRTLGGPSEQR